MVEKQRMPAFSSPSAAAVPVSRTGWNGHAPPVDDSSSPNALYQRLAQLKPYEDLRNKLLEDALAQYESLVNTHRQKTQDYERQIKDYQAAYLQAQETSNSLREYVYSEIKVAVLLDGNGMLFHDYFMNAGDHGGKAAANALYDSINSFIQQRVPDLGAFKVVTRIYINARALAESCVAAGLVDKAGVLESFLQGFVNARDDCYIVDVGPGKDRIFKKISENFDQFNKDITCQQILLGCSHDSQYIGILDELASTNLLQKVTLLEGPPFEPEFKSLPFATEKFTHVFNGTRVSNYATSSEGSNGYHSPFTPPPGLHGIKKQTSRTDSFSSSSTTLSHTGPVTWATAAQKAAALPHPVSTPPPKPTLAATGIPRNKAGQRVDPLPRAYDKAEVDRVKRIKMCNVHFLRRECRYGDDCTHVHAYSPSASELSTLKLVARMAPCQFGSACDDAKCIYGHRCPAPEKVGPGGTGTRKGVNCIFGDDCRFPVELHGIDTVVVRAVVIKG